jgi:hypothetical protein
VPVLVIDGNADRVLPYDKTGARLPGLIKDMRLVTIDGGFRVIPMSCDITWRARRCPVSGHPGRVSQVIEDSPGE